MIDNTENHTRSVLHNSTNVHHYSENISYSKLLTPNNRDGTKKRTCAGLDGSVSKRPRLAVKEEHEECQSDNDEGGVVVVKNWTRRQCVFKTLSAMSISHPSPRAIRRNLLPSRNILQTFVSSNKSDVYRCYSTQDNQYTMLPYACSYSNGGRNGSPPLLAIGTEQGPVMIVKTSKRQDWDYEPQRATLQPHDNGVFDVKWSNDDSRLATGSADKSIKISSVQTQQTTRTLRGHSATTKCISWDPNHQELLSSGGRDGSICLWDLRLSNSQNTTTNGVTCLSPVLVIPAAHGQDMPTKGRKKKVLPLPKSVTGLIYALNQPHGLISSGSADGILRFWDLRLVTIPRDKEGSCEPLTSMPPLSLSSVDPTTAGGTRRPRGITSIAIGNGPTAGLVFALGADSQLHTYALPTLMPLGAYSHADMRISSFYVRIAVSPCGKWLASGSSGKNGSLFLFDVSNASRSLGFAPSQCSNAVVRLQGQSGEVSAVDWAEDMVASSADDHTVRIWRPDLDVYNKCVSEPGEHGWNWCWSSKESTQPS